MAGNNTADDRFRERLDSYLDGELDPGEQAAFEAELRDDPTRSEALDDARSILRLVRELPRETPPPRFLWAVQQRIRRRTRGRYFAYHKEPSMVLEAAVCAVLVFLTAALYLVGGPKPPTPRAGDSAIVTERVNLAPADRRLFEYWGRIDVVGTSVSGSDLEVRLEVSEDRYPELRDALAATPRLRLVETSVHRLDGSVWLTVRAPAGPRTDGHELQ